MGGDYKASSLQWLGQVHCEPQACMHEPPACRYAAVLEEQFNAPLGVLNSCLSEHFRVRLLTLLLLACSAARLGT